MAIQFNNGVILFTDGGQIAMSSDCCCGGSTSCNDYIPSGTIAADVDCDGFFDSWICEATCEDAPSGGCTYKVQQNFSNQNGTYIMTGSCEKYSRHYDLNLTWMDFYCEECGGGSDTYTLPVCPDNTVYLETYYDAILGMVVYGYMFTSGWDISTHTGGLSFFQFSGLSPVGYLGFSYCGNVPLYSASQFWGSLPITGTMHFCEEDCSAHSVNWSEQIGEITFYEVA